MNLFKSIASFFGATKVTGGFGSQGILRQQICGACAELTAFRTAVENLPERVRRSPRLGRAMLWRNLIPKGTFMKNIGVTRSTLQIKASEPADDQSLWYDIALSSGQPSPSCDTNYEDIGVGYYERTYSPRRRRFRGPVICRENLTFQHNPGAFINSYVDELGRVLARVWEFSLRQDYIKFGNVYVDGTKTTGPNGLATAARAFEGISQDRLNDMATDMINVGAGSVADEGGYTTFGENGPIFPLEIDMNSSGNILKANTTIRQDANYASMGADGKGDLSLWRPIGATRVIGNFRHVTTNVPLRFNYTGGAYVNVTPFKDITAVGSDGVMLTTAYQNAAFEGAVAMLPSVFTAEVVAPDNAGLNFDPSTYNGDWRFITGGERICSPSEYDPEHHKGRHFASIEYAPRPDAPYEGSLYIYKRCATTKQVIFCS